jgi:hypothetical protein
MTVVIRDAGGKLHGVVLWKNRLRAQPHGFGIPSDAIGTRATL